MHKPDMFNLPFVTVRNTPYLQGFPENPEHSEGGVLGQGQLVWTMSSTSFSHAMRSQPAFVDGVGVVSLNPGWLIPVGILTATREKP